MGDNWAMSRADRPCDFDLITFSSAIADEASEILRRHYGAPIEQELKADGSVVTEADREVERRVRAMIQRYYPGHGVIGEEFAAERTEAEYIWCVDPLDNTSEFVAGSPNFGFLLALLWRERIILGVMDMPITGTRLIGADGHGTLLNGSQVSTRSCAHMCNAMISAGQPTNTNARCDRAIRRLCECCKHVSFGCDCFSYGLVAAGKVDVAVSYGLDLYDFAALEPILRNAGGSLTDWSGKQARRSSEGAMLGLGDPQSLAPIVKVLRNEASLNDGERCDHKAPQP